jgi:hypothetical protein
MTNNTRSFVESKLIAKKHREVKSANGHLRQAESRRNYPPDYLEDNIKNKQEISTQIYLSFFS